MIQAIQVSDAVRCLLLNVPKGPNLACPKGFLLNAKKPSNAALWKDTLARRRDRITMVAWDGPLLGGLASARTRTGCRVWEVDRLYGPVRPVDSGTDENVPDGCADSVFLTLLEELVQVVGRRKGERVMVRLPSDDPMVDLVRRAGFFSYFEEYLLEGTVRAKEQNGSLLDAPLQRRLPQDDYPLFQLFCAGTPQQVRVGLGLTFDQWRDAQEIPDQSGKEWVLRHEDRITGWLSLRFHQRVAEGNIMVHPGYPDSLPTVVDAALARGGLHKWLVPDYQVMEKSLLIARGFRETARYTALIKTVAAPVSRPAMAAVEA